MRIKLDANGYVLNVYWGCHSGNCTEYTGRTPYGYSDLNDWSENAFINAYYLNENGDLILDANKLADLEEKAGQQAVDNAPVLHKDLYGTSEILDSQYQSATAKGKVLVLENVKRINPKVKLTNVDCYADSQVDIITQGKNMLRNDAITETIAGVTFTKNIDGSISINGTATEEIEYNLSGSGINATSIFVLKKGLDYYLNLGGLSCEMRFYDGTTSQVYVGEDGIINLSEDKRVTQVVIKIPNGTEVNKTIYPMLEYGTSASEYESYKARTLTIDLSDYISSEVLYPADNLYPKDNLYPLGTGIEYIYIENGKVSISVNGSLKYSIGNVNLFDGFNTIYTLQDTNIEMTYYLNVLDVNSLEFLQGKATTTNKFKILEDGSIECKNATLKDGNIMMESTEINPTVTVTSSLGSAYRELSLMGGAVWVNRYTDTTKEENTEQGYLSTDAVMLDVANPDKSGVIYNHAQLGFNTTNNYGPNYEPVLDLWKNGVNIAQVGEVCSYFKNLRYEVIASNSLEKLKKNFSKFNNGLKLINQSDIYSYNFKDENDETKKHIGLVIGENYNTPKEILTDDNQAIDLYSMISVAWQSIKELNTKVEELEKRIKELESDNNGEN